MARSPTTRVHMSPSCVHHYSAPPTVRPTLIEDAEPKKGDGPAQAIMAIMLLTRRQLPAVLVTRW